MGKFLTEDEMILHLIATALIRFTSQQERSIFLSAPYPIELQRGFDLLITNSFRKGRIPPRTVLEVLDWCGERPLSQWPLEFEGRELAYDALLLANGLPTSWCEEWACAATNVEDEITENRIMLSALNICRTANNNRLYSDFRRLLIEKPVIDPLELLARTRKFDDLQAILYSAYPTAPAAYNHSGQFIECKHCRSLLVLDKKGNLCCEDSICRTNYATKRGRQWSEGVLLLERSLRRFVTRPGIAELRIHDKLKKRGYEVELWPDFDAYDLKIVYKNEVWAVDVKDWSSPSLLARLLNQKGPFRQSLSAPWDRAFWVFPKNRISKRNYMATFKNTYRHLNSPVEAAFETDFLRRLP